MARTDKAFSAESNYDRIAAVLARRASGAAGPHQDRRNRRQRTRGSVRVALRREALA